MLLFSVFPGKNKPPSLQMDLPFIPPVVCFSRFLSLSLCFPLTSSPQEQTDQEKFVPILKKANVQKVNRHSSVLFSSSVLKEKEEKDEKEEKEGKGKKGARMKKGKSLTRFFFFYQNLKFLLFIYLFLKFE